MGRLCTQGHPPEIVNKIRNTIAAAATAPDVVARKLEVDLVASTPEEFARFQHQNIEHWSRIVKEMNIKGN